jgi:hypothetical protein
MASNKERKDLYKTVLYLLILVCMCLLFGGLTIALLTLSTLSAFYNQLMGIPFFGGFMVTLNKLYKIVMEIIKDLKS